MSRALGLDRKAKLSLAAMLLVVLIVVGAAVRASVVAVAGDSLLAEEGSTGDDEIVQIGGHTLLLKRGSAGNKIANWLHAGKKGSRAFEVGERSFVSNSDALTADGQRRVATFATMMSNVSELHARILVSSLKQDPRLAQNRAQRLRSEVIGHGVPGSRIDVQPAPIAGGAALAQQPELVVVLST